MHASGWIRAGQAHEGVVIRDRRSAKARYCCLSHQYDTADADGSRCRKKLLCTTCFSCAFTFIIVLIHGCCHHTHFGSTSHTLSGNLQFCRWSTQFPSCMWRYCLFEREHPQTCFSNVIHGLNGMTCAARASPLHHENVRKQP